MAKINKRFLGVDSEDNIISPEIRSKNMALGAIHISLPFKSMDDVQFSGMYAPLADELVKTLQQHLQDNPPEDSEDKPDYPEPEDQDTEGVGNAVEQLPGGNTGLINSDQYTPPQLQTPIEQLKASQGLK